MPFMSTYNTAVTKFLQTHDIIEKPEEESGSYKEKKPYIDYMKEKKHCKDDSDSEDEVDDRAYGSSKLNSLLSKK